MKGIWRMRIAGESMSPILRDGALLLARSYMPWEHVRAGDIVVLKDPRQTSRVIVKRVERSLVDGTYIVRGDNAGASTDSASFGPVTRAHVVGKVLFCDYNHSKERCADVAYTYH